MRICTKRATGVKRAVKIIRKDLLTPKEKNRLFEEVRALSKLDHPSVVKLYEVYQDSKRFYVISDLYVGQKVLANLLARDVLNESDVIPLMQQLLSAIEYCHAKNLTHKNLRIDNLLLKEKDPEQLKVIDFGTAERDSRNQNAPECDRSLTNLTELEQHEAAEKADIWNCGVILHILLTGKAPTKYLNSMLVFA